MSYANWPTRLVGSKPCGDLDIAVDIACDQLVEANAGKQAGTNASGMTVTPQRDHGHSHPQRFAGRRRSVVWERIECDVNLVIAGKMLSAAELGTEKNDTFRCDAALAKASLKQGLGGPIAEPWALEQEARSRYPMDRSCPDIECRSRQLGQIVKRSKGKGAAGNTGRCCRFRCLSRRTIQTNPPSMRTSLSLAHGVCPLGR